jgi:hypothetical protein
MRRKSAELREDGSSGLASGTMTYVHDIDKNGID